MGEILGESFAVGFGDDLGDFAADDLMGREAPCARCVKNAGRGHREIVDLGVGSEKIGDIFERDEKIFEGLVEEFVGDFDGFAADGGGAEEGEADGVGTELVDGFERVAEISERF